MLQGWYTWTYYVTAVKAADEHVELSAPTAEAIVVELNKGRLRD
jgi:hypothetical protein